MVEVHLENERLDLLDAAKARLAAAPKVQQCYYVTGDADFMLVITVPTRTLVVMDRVKVGLEAPLSKSSP